MLLYHQGLITQFSALIDSNTQSFFYIACVGLLEQGGKKNRQDSYAYAIDEITIGKDGIYLDGEMHGSILCPQYILSHTRRLIWSESKIPCPYPRPNRAVCMVTERLRLAK